MSDLRGDLPVAPGDEAELDLSGHSDVYGLSRPEVRRRSLAGIVYLTSSSVANLVIGFLASLVLARVLTPSDFGVVAIGSTATLLVGALADGGLGAGMIRRPEPPTSAELRTLNGIQLTLTLLLCVPGAGVALAFGRSGLVTAIMVMSVPIATLQTPGRIKFARDMRYDRQLAVDLGGQVSSQIFSVVAVLLGAGVWGLAGAAVVKSVVGTVLIFILGTRFEFPSLRGWRGYGALLRFGMSFQASWYALIAREQSLNVVVAVISGVTALGIWSFTNRIFQLPSIAFSSLYVVGFPAMASLLAREDDPAPIILRTVRRASIAGALIFSWFAAVSPKLIPSLFGQEWHSAATIVPFICLSTMILGSISVASNSYLSAVGRPGVVALAAVALGIVWVAATASLLPFLGVVAIGVGNLLGALAEAFILDFATRSSAGVRPYRPLLRPLLVATAAGAGGWIFCTLVPGGFVVAVGAGVLTIALCSAGLWAVCRNDLVDTIGLATGAIRDAIPGL